VLQEELSKPDVSKALAGYQALQPSQAPAPPSAPPPVAAQPAAPQ
jgi:hypothetical protein